MTETLFSLLPDDGAAYGVGYPPAADRQFWMVIVDKCVRCGTGHLHRSGRPVDLFGEGIERVCPVTRQMYRIVGIRSGTRAGQ